MIFTKGYCKDHGQNIELATNKLKENGLKCNIEKLSSKQTEMEYFNFRVTRYGITPINGKIEVITNMKAPTYQKYVRKFIGVINYYHDVWSRQSDMLVP